VSYKRNPAFKSTVNTMDILPESESSSSHITPKNRPRSFAPAFTGRTPKLLLPEVPLSALKVYIFLSDVTYDGWTSPYRRQIIDATGLSESGVTSGIAWLMRKGWILRQRHFYGYFGTRYMILDSPIPPSSDFTPEVLP